MNNAFLRSYECLSAIYSDKAFSTLQLNKSLAFCDKKDKALVTKIVYGTLDNDIYLRFAINKFTERVRPKILPFLMIGAYCLKFLSIPRYAVVNDVVELAKITGDKRSVGFVNATLKTLADAFENDNIDLPKDEIERLSVKYSYPLWALRKLIKDYGKEEAEKIISFKLPEETTVRVNVDKISPDKFSSLADCKPTIFPDAFALSGAISVDPSLYTAQSLASMAVTHALSPKGQEVLDCCAAPGGKAVYAKQLGAKSVTACDLHAHRVRLIDSYASRLGVEITVVCRDSIQYNAEWQEKFDRVLCDVPCSGFGVLDSRPDVKLFRQNKDISDLMKTQYAIIDNCSRYVKRGGLLVYSTCTLFDNENGQIVRKFLKNHADFAFGTINLPFDSPANGKGSYQFLPHRDGMQGFYCAVLKRT